MISLNFKQIKKGLRPLHAFSLILLLSIILSMPVSLKAQTYGNTWANGNLKTEMVLRDVVWSGARFIAVGDNGVVYTSPSGSTWTRESTPIGTSDHLFGVGTNGAGNLVAVGRDQLILYSQNNGDSWTIVNSRITNTPDIYKVAYGNGKFVAADEGGGVWISADGSTGWTKYNSGLPLRCIAFANGYFLAGTVSGGIVRSATGDAGSWENVGSLGTAVRDIDYGNGKWLAVGRNIATSSSANGSGWTIRVKLETDYNFVDQLFSACATAPGTFIAVGEHGLMLNSADGITWRQGNSKSKRFLFAAAYGNSASGVAAVGNGGPRGLPPAEEELQLYSTHYSRSGGTPPPVIVPKPILNAIIITTPNGGEQWVVGQQYQIQWTTKGTVANVDIDYSYDGKTSWIRLTSNYINRGYIYWTIPNTVSTNCYVRVAEIEGNPTDTSNAAFAIVNKIETKTITITAPNGGEHWLVGQRYDIKWTSTGPVGNVNIDYSKDGKKTWIRLTSNFANRGIISWPIPDAVSTNCYVRITDTTGSPTDSSNSAFAIDRPAPAGTITVKSPNGGEIWEGYSSHNITWTSTGTVGDVKIVYSTDNGVTWKYVISATLNDGSYGWTVPEAPSSKCLVRINAISDSFITDTGNAVFRISSGKPPKIQALWDRYNFGYIMGGAAPTGAQPLLIGNMGGKTLHWSAAKDQAWIRLDKTSGTGDAAVYISVVPTGLAVGDYAGTITISDPGASNSPQKVAVNLKIKNAEDDQAPFGDMATPADGSKVYGSIPVTGWALDDVEIKSIKLYYNVEGYIGDMLFVDGARPDVAAAYPNYPYYRRAGWGYLLLTNSLKDGVYSLTVVAIDNSGKSTTFGPKKITIDNGHTHQPFGNIDTPAPNGNASGAAYMNWGWVLSPLPHMIAKDGSTIQVWVDANFMGTLGGYNGPNNAIKALFPGLKNSDGPTGFYRLDTTQFVNGVHFISWTVINDGGHKEGIGSRYFTIYNAGNNVNPSDVGDEISAPEMAVDFSLPSLEPLRIKRGYDRESDVQESEIYPDEHGRVFQEISELQRVEIQLGSEGGVMGYLAVGDKLEPLPIGSSLDPVRGIFCWQPGPGFVGDYELVFFGKDSSGTLLKKSIYLRVVPLFQRE
ncbi:MAG: Ig-like domain-containing protein [Candidatus Aminicenantes bacterium]|nr:Ig-like domain-containing protein [Candidatus Aminicenantes bacterium]